MKMVLRKHWFAWIVTTTSIIRSTRNGHAFSLQTMTLIEMNAFLQATGSKSWETVDVSYNQKLDQAISKIDATRSMVADYIKQVTDQTGKYFMKEQADILIRGAKIVI
ncbi:hypothetical protein [Paenibacillus harenae]|uniref:hypothetical protein n=1 Tax=Paenibacillus harenae TaxID=306543 RepID=UPI0003F81F62|nr:hypothetical protein [Paenibacillus harenae]